MEKVDRITVDRCNNMAARVNECKRHWQESCSHCRYFGLDCHGTFDLLHHIEMDYKVMIRQLKGGAKHERSSANGDAAELL